MLDEEAAATCGTLPVAGVGVGVGVGWGTLPVAVLGWAEPF